MSQITIISAIVLFFCIGCLPKTGLSQDTTQIFSEIRHGLVRVGMIIDIDKDGKDGVKSIQVKWLGTGFLVDDKCTFATATHVIKPINPSSIVIRFQKPGDLTQVITISARILYEDAKKDVSFLKIDKYNNQPCMFGDLYKFKLSEDVPPSITGETIIIVGYPRISEKNLDIPIVRKGIVATAEIKDKDGKNMLLLDLTGVKGFSGSPVVLEKTQEVIGIVYGPGGIDRYLGFEWATPITKKDYKNAINSNNKP